MSRVADDFYRVAHDDRSGRCRVPGRVVALGLAAGLLAELVLDGQVRVVGGRLVPGGAERPPPERVLRELAGQVAVAPGLDLAGWLGRLAPAAAEWVRYRLVGEGALVRVRSRSLGRRRAAWVPTDPNDAVWPSIRLAKALSEGHELPVAEQVLAALVDVTGLLGTVLWCKPDHTPGYPRVVRVRRELAGELAEIVAYTDAAVGSGVLAGRGG